jgi:chromosome segregation ATPase
MASYVQERTVVSQSTLSQYRHNIEQDAIKRFEALLGFLRAHLSALEQQKAEASKDRRRLSTDVSTEIQTDLQETAVAHAEAMQQLSTQRSQIATSQSALDAELSAARAQLAQIRQTEMEKISRGAGEGASAVAALRIARVKADSAESRVRDLTSVRRDLVVRLQQLQAEASSHEGSGGTAPPPPGSKRSRSDGDMLVSADTQAQHDIVERK